MLTIRGGTHANTGGLLELRIVGYGLHGDPLHEGKLDLPELLDTPTVEDWAWARGFIAARRWQEAVSYRRTAPHEYTVRTWAVGESASRDFDAFVIAIRRFGYADYFHRLRHIYWVVDGLKYWTMGWPTEETVVINRASVDAPEF